MSDVTSLPRVSKTDSCDLDVTSLPRVSKTDSCHLKLTVSGTVLHFKYWATVSTFDGDLKKSTGSSAGKLLFDSESQILRKNMQVENQYDTL